MEKMQALAQQALSFYACQDAEITGLSLRKGSHIFQVKSSGGARYVLRARDATRIPKGVMDVQASWLGAIQQTGNVNVPVVVRTIAGESHAGISDGSADFRFVLFRWVPGEAFPSPIESRDATLVGRVLACLHAASEGLVDEKTFQGRRFNSDFLFGASSCLWNDGRNTGLESKQREIFLAAREVIDPLLRSIEKSAGMSGLIHGDAGYQNLILDHGKPGVIDFDEFGLGPSLFDLAEHFRAQAHWNHAPALKDALLASYMAARGSKNVNIEHFDILLAAAFISFVNWAVCLTDPDERKACEKWFPFCVEKVRELCGL